MSADLLLVAAGGLAREVAAVCRRTSDAGAPGPRLLGFLDDDPLKQGVIISGLPVLGPLESFRDFPQAQLVLCAGQGRQRRALARRLSALGVSDDRYHTVIDSSVQVPAGSTVCVGSILMAGTVLTAEVTVGRHVVCMPNVTLTHDDVLEDFVTLAAGVTLGGGVHIGEAAYLGMNSAVRELRRIGAEAVLGMGSALVDDQPAGTTWVGVPARELTRAKG